MPLPGNVSYQIKVEKVFCDLVFILLAIDVSLYCMGFNAASTVFQLYCVAWLVID